MWFRIFLIAAAFTLSILPAQACSCNVANAGCQVPVADIIVRATVASKEIDQPRLPFVPPASNGTGQRSARATRPPGVIPPPAHLWSVKVTLSVSEPFRGAASNMLVVRTDLSDCGYPFEVGHEYLVFANWNQENLVVTTCSATQPSKVAVARIEQLRALRDGTNLPDAYGFVGTHPLRSDEAGWEQVQPMAGLTVTARSDSGEYRTQTAEDGLYGFRGLPRGPQYHLSVVAPTGRVALPGSTCAMNFEVFWDGLISGTIVRRDGQPASGMITAQYAGPEPADFFIAAVKDGRFEIRRIPPGRYRLMFLPIVADRQAGEPVYYPGTLTQSAAALIDVGEGAHVEGLLFTIF